MPRKLLNIVIIMTLVFLPAKSIFAASVITDSILAKAIRTELVLPANKELKSVDLQRLKSLYPSEDNKRKITSLQGLEFAVNIQQLFLPGQKITSIKPIAKLKKLTFLAITANISPLQKLKLEWLGLSDNKIKDLTPLSNHPTLKHLYLDNNLIKNIEVLTTIPLLEDVSLANNPLNEQAKQVIQRLESQGVVVKLELDKDL